MSKPNKYHPTGRLYTSKELSARRWALVPTYVVRGYRLNGGAEARALAYTNPDRPAKSVRKARRTRHVR